MEMDGEWQDKSSFLIENLDTHIQQEKLTLSDSIKLLAQSISISNTSAPILNKIEEKLDRRNKEDDMFTILKSQIDTLNENVSSLTKSSASKGKFMEKNIIQLLQNAFHNRNEIKIENCSGKTAEGDIKIIISSLYPILLEIKNHEKEVPKAHITKFQRDSEKNDYHFNILFSSCSEISNYPHFFIEKCTTLSKTFIGRYNIYIACDEHILVTTIQMIALFIGIYYGANNRESYQIEMENKMEILKRKNKNIETKLLLVKEMLFTKLKESFDDLETEVDSINTIS
jgi:hypothetical protein